mmetsp:Transcript_60390/g.99909  ORF Transcript_60390/g.99909 Transcript_60390/m.99909 type:complete len:178 (-) Transcript_60390:1724-2257(-)
MLVRWPDIPRLHKFLQPNGQACHPGLQGQKDDTTKALFHICITPHIISRKWQVKYKNGDIQGIVRALCAALSSCISPPIMTRHVATYSSKMAAFSVPRGHTLHAQCWHLIDIEGDIRNIPWITGTQNAKKITTTQEMLCPDPNLQRNVPEMLLICQLGEGFAWPSAGLKWCRVFGAA